MSKVVFGGPKAAVIAPAVARREQAEIVVRRDDERASDDEGGDMTVGEDIYTTLLAGLRSATIEEQFAIGAAFQKGTPWSELPDNVRDLFEDVGEELTTDDATEVE